MKKYEELMFVARETASYKALLDEHGIDTSALNKLVKDVLKVSQELFNKEAARIEVSLGERDFSDKEVKLDRMKNRFMEMAGLKERTFDSCVAFPDVMEELQAIERDVCAEDETSECSPDASTAHRNGTIRALNKILR